MFRILLITLWVGLSPIFAAGLKVAVLHPLLGDLARQVGGNQVEVIDLIGPNGDPHHFEPKPEDLAKSEGATLYLVAGMGLEGYLPKLKAIIANKATLVEVGETLPTLEDADNGHDHSQCDGVHHGIDPHWWHSIDRFRRAIAVVAKAMADASPENEGLFRKNAGIYRNQLDELERWTRREISNIPRDHRHLATSHAAFNYFCKDFGFTPHPVQGLNREQMPDPRELAALVMDLKKNHVTAIFPEKESNPKILTTLTHDTGIRLGDPLISDGTGEMGYIGMIRHNVAAIVKGLRK